MGVNLREIANGEEFMINAEILGISVHIFLPQGVADGVRIALPAMGIV